MERSAQLDFQHVSQTIKTELRISTVGSFVTLQGRRHVLKDFTNPEISPDFVGSGCQPTQTTSS